MVKRFSVHTQMENTSKQIPIYAPLHPPKNIHLLSQSHAHKHTHTPVTHSSMCSCPETFEAATPSSPQQAFAGLPAAAGPFLNNPVLQSGLVLVAHLSLPF